MGVPQGSVLGPSLVTIFYGGVLRFKVSQGWELVAYADDLALVAQVRNVDQLKRRVETHYVALRRGCWPAFYCCH